MSSPVNEPRIEIIGDRIRLHIDLTGNADTETFSRQTSFLRPKTKENSKISDKSTNSKQTEKSSHKYFQATKFYRKNKQADGIIHDRYSRPATAKFPSNSMKNELYGVVSLVFTNH